MIGLREILGKNTFREIKKPVAWYRKAIDGTPWNSSERTFYLKVLDSIVRQKEMVSPRQQQILDDIEYGRDPNRRYSTKN